MAPVVSARAILMWGGLSSAPVAVRLTSRRLGSRDLELWSARGFLARSPGSPTGKHLSTRQELVTQSSTQDPAWAPRSADRVVSPICGGETESQGTHPRGRASLSARMCRTPTAPASPKSAPLCAPSPSGWGARAERDAHRRALPPPGGAAWAGSAVTGPAAVPTTPSLWAREPHVARGVEGRRPCSPVGVLGPV